MSPSDDRAHTQTQKINLILFPSRALLQALTKKTIPSTSRVPNNNQTITYLQSLILLAPCRARAILRRLCPFDIPAIHLLLPQLLLAFGDYSRSGPTFPRWNRIQRPFPGSFFPTDAASRLRKDQTFSPSTRTLRIAMIYDRRSDK